MFSYFKSRTNWTLVLMYVVTFAPYAKNVVPDSWKWAVDAVLAALAVYFHTHPSQQYPQP